MQGLGQWGMGSTILVNRLAKPSSPVGKTHEFSGFFSRALIHVFQKCRSCCSVPRPPTCQRICNLFQSRFLKTKLLLSQKKLISFLGQHFSFFGENIPHLRRPDCTKHLSIGGNQLLMHRKVALAISFQPPESLDVS